MFVVVDNERGLGSLLEVVDVMEGMSVMQGRRYGRGSVGMGIGGGGLSDSVCKMAGNCVLERPLEY